MEAINSKELQGSDMQKNKKEINNHKKIAARLLKTAELHLEIANHISSNNYNSAVQVAANAYVILNQVRDNQHKIIYNMM
jgi:hypothetical protein